MLLALCAALSVSLPLAAAGPAPLALPELAPDEARSAQYTLPGESLPTFYDVRLFLDPDNNQFFTGAVDMRVLPQGATNHLVLHAMELEILNVTVVGERSSDNLFANFTLADDDTHLLTIRLSESIPAASPHTVNIQYRGHFAENMFGVYLSTYTDPTQGIKRLITSQLQPTFARRAFPCYDEPAIKAVFRTTIYAPPDYPVVRSNMPERSAADNLKPEVAGYVKHEFEDTPVMSTYLLAYLVSDLAFISNEEEPLWRLPFRVYSRNSTQETARFALEFGQLNMAALEEYIEWEYILPKMDKAAVPDFAAGAMENWGLVIYREVALLVQEGVTTTAIRQNIARIISHENMHQWFGNEVSPLSWTFTWLNEGFANFFENYATDLVLPNYRMMDQYVLILQGVMQSDAVLGVNPMTHPVYTPSEVLGTFNAVAYQKSGSVIRMTEHFLTPEVFQRGLVIYIRDNSRRAASPSSLYAALQQALDQSDHSLPYSVATVLDLWTNQRGFPVVEVRRAAPTAHSVHVTQERFLTDASMSSGERWHIPLNWVLSSSPDFSDTRAQDWLPPTFPARSFNIPGLADADWFIFNKQQTGYYRVNYEPSNWAALARALHAQHEVVHVLNRAQLLDDAFNLARNGRLSYQYPLQLSQYLVQEKDYVPWASANTALSYLDIVLSGSDIYPLFQQYMLNLTANLYEELGFDALDSDEHVTAFHRNIALDINCRHGNAACVQRAQDLLDQFINDSSGQLNPDVAAVALCSGLRAGSAEHFAALWARYLASDDSGHQSVLLNALGCTANADRLQFFLQQVVDEQSAVREQDRHSLVVAAINASPDNMEAALDFVIDNFAAIQPRVQGLTGTTNILNAFGRRLNSDIHTEKVEEFSRRHGAILTAGELAALGALRETLSAALSWRALHSAAVGAWLHDQYDALPDGAATGALPTATLVAALLALALLLTDH